MALFTYFYGELGYEPLGAVDELVEAEYKAIAQSIVNSHTAIAIWNDCDDICSVAINGELFDKYEH